MATSPAAVAAVPPHVDPRLVWDHSFDSFNIELDDPFRAVRRLHEVGDILWATDVAFGRPGWLLTRSDLIAKVMMDHETFSAERPGMVADLLGEPVRLNPIEIDPPAHHGYRRLLNPHFTPKALRELEGAVRTGCVELIRALRPGGCEFIHDFAVPFPSHVFLDLMHMPRAMLADFIGWEERLMRAPDPQDRVEAARSIYAYLKAHKERQKAAPDSELLRAMTSGEVDGGPLDHLEAMGMFYVLYVGRLDTVYSTLGWTLRHLATHPELQERLRGEPELIPDAVEEFCRAFSVVVTHRQVAKDCVFEGVAMRAGDEVHLPLMLANRDPALFVDPDTVNIERKARHIAFGTGAHNCLGVHLAKRELRIVLEEFLSRFRNIRIPAGETYRFHAGRTFGIDYLPLEWDPA